MKKIELLAPSGSLEALKAAIASGTDAVYLGGNQFGARAYAQNFSNEEIREAIKLAHLYNVKVYVTVNTLIYDHEFSEVMAFIDFLYHADVDAVIVQDLGLLRMIRKYYGDLPIHASTQMTVHNLPGVELLKAEGVSRVVLARENTLTEVKKIIDETAVETEVFVHGALCVCYSGQCLMSSLIGGRSGNRGRCAQPYRKLYSLSDESGSIVQNKYLLSPKDLNTVEHIGDLIEAGVTSLKIEGRMKDPGYVATVVAAYRKAVDSYYREHKVNLTEQDFADLTQIFNRGFTKGFLFNEHDRDFINHVKNNNAGVLCGKVTYINGERVTIALSRPLHVQDGIYFNKTNKGLVVTKIYKDKKSVIAASAWDTVTIEVKEKVYLDDTVYKTKDYHLEEKAKRYELPKLTINGEISLAAGEKARLTFTDDLNHQVTVKSDFIVQESVNQPLDTVKITAQISKLGNTPFVLDKLIVKSDPNIFIVMSALNDLRRHAVAELIKLRECRYNRGSKQSYQYFDDSTIEMNDVELAVYCETYEQYQAAKTFGVKRIYLNSDLTEVADNDVYWVTERINQNLNRIPNQNIVVSDLGSLYLAQLSAQEVVTNYNLNVTNSETIKYLLTKNVDRVTLSYELNDLSYQQLRFKDKSKLEIIIYGYQEAMITRYCLFKSLHNCTRCPRKTRDKYYLTDEKNEKFYVRLDNSCRMHIYNSKNLVLAEEAAKLKNWGYRNFRINLTKENYDEALKVIKAYQALLNNDDSSLIADIVNKHKDNNSYTRGYFNKEIL